MALVTVDFDGTLYKGDSFTTMFKMAKREFKLKEWSVVVGGLIKAIYLGIVKGKQTFRKQFFLSFARLFKGKTKAEMDDFFRKLVEFGKDDIHFELVNTIREHLKQGDDVIVLSGALKPFLEAFIQKIELDVPVIGSEILYNDEAICTGEVEEFINGEFKVEKVKQWMNETNHSDERIVWAYADSESDLPLFDFATHPVVVNPDQKMKDVADKNGWPVFN